MNAIKDYVRNKIRDIKHDYSIWKYSTKLRIIHYYRTYRDKIIGVYINARLQTGLQHRGRQTTDNTVIKPVKIKPRLTIAAKVFRAKDGVWQDFGIVSDSDRKGENR